MEIFLYHHLQTLSTLKKLLESYFKFLFLYLFGYFSYGPHLYCTIFKVWIVALKKIVAKLFSFSMMYLIFRNFLIIHLLADNKFDLIPRYISYSLHPTIWILKLNTPLININLLFLLRACALYLKTFIENNSNIFYLSRCTVAELDFQITKIKFTLLVTFYFKLNRKYDISTNFWNKKSIDSHFCNVATQLKLHTLDILKLSFKLEIKN